MADNYYHDSQRVSGKMVVCASMGAIAIGAPLLGMMGFSLLASATLLLVCSPLLLLSSPLLLGASFVLMAALAGFVVAISMAIVGVSSLVWVAREARVRFIGGMRKVEDSRQRIKGKKLDYYWGDPFATTSKA